MHILPLPLIGNSIAVVEEIVWRLPLIRSQYKAVSAFSLISLLWRYLLIVSIQMFMVKQQPPPHHSLSEAHLC